MQQRLLLPEPFVVNADNMDIIQQWPDKCIDLVVADPPYYSGPEKRKHYGSDKSAVGVKRKDYPVTEEWEVPGAAFFDEIIRVSKNQIIWGCNYYEYQFGPGRIVWDKCNGESSFSDAEIAYCSMHDSVRLFRFMWNGMMQRKSPLEGHIMQGNKSLNEEKIHPTQKPVALYRWILHKYAQPGWKILDPNLGSGSSQIAAYEDGFCFYGIEKATVHFINSQVRFQMHRKQIKLQL